MKKGLFIYSVVLVVFGLGIFLTLQFGRTLHPPTDPTISPNSAAVAPSASAKTGSDNYTLFANLRDNLQNPLSRLFLQLVIIVVAARVAGIIFGWLGQPAVIGEMVAGILLGPSLFGWVWPQAFHFVFADGTLATLKLLSQIGVCLFMFMVGIDLDVSHLRHRAQTALVVSHVSILFPYFLGVVTSLFLFSTLAASRATFLSFALFMGISMSITAFPVLARILQERGLAQTSLGVTAITCAAVDDVTAWSVLAFVIAIINTGGLAATALTVALVLLFLAAMLWIVKPLLPKLIGKHVLQGGTPGKGLIASVLVFVFASALMTEVIGIHALFGAFLAGVVIPQNSEFRNALRLRLEHFGSSFLLPLFFAFTGLRTQIGLLDNSGLWWICLGLIFIATLGKLGGSMIAARLTGLDWNESFSLGALMNTRGLMELIALNIGYDLGILSPRIFTMMVLMALVTTFLTAPLLSLANYWRTRRELAVHPA